MATFGGNLKRIRQQRKITQKALAKATGIGTTVLSRMENNGQGLPETPTILKLAKGLRCTVDDLIAGEDKEYDAIASGVSRDTGREIPPQINDEQSYELTSHVSPVGYTSASQPLTPRVEPRGPDVASQPSRQDPAAPGDPSSRAYQPPSDQHAYGEELLAQARALHAHASHLEELGAALLTGQVAISLRERDANGHQSDSSDRGQDDRGAAGSQS